MKTNSTMKRLGAFILAGSIAALSAMAADSTTSAPATSAPASASTTASTETTKPEVKKGHARKHRRHHHDMAAVTKKHEKNGKLVLGAVAVNEPKGKKKDSEVKLAKVYHGSAADKAGLRAGDVIWKIDGQRVTSASQIKRELRGEKRGSTVPVEVYRHGKREEFRVKIGAV